jgi:hypothetical protein
MMPCYVVAFGLIILALTGWFVKILIDMRKTVEQPLITFNDFSKDETIVEDKE